MRRMHIHVAVGDLSESIRFYSAKSDKAWTVDPQGVAWDAFRTLESAPVYGESHPELVAATESASACCVPTPSAMSFRSRA